MDLVTFLGALAALGATVTASLGIIRRAVDPGTRFPTIVWPIAALAVGVGYCLGWQVNLAPALVELVPALAKQAPRLDGVSGQVLTGLMAGAVAGFLHDFFDFIRSKTGPAG